MVWRALARADTKGHVGPEATGGWPGCGLGLMSSSQFPPSWFPQYWADALLHQVFMGRSSFPHDTVTRTLHPEVVTARMLEFTKFYKLQKGLFLCLWDLLKIPPL